MRTRVGARGRRRVREDTAAVEPRARDEAVAVRVLHAREARGVHLGRAAADVHDRVDLLADVTHLRAADTCRAAAAVRTPRAVGRAGGKGWLENSTKVAPTRPLPMRPLDPTLLPQQPAPHPAAALPHLLDVFVGEVQEAEVQVEGLAGREG